jgi:signal transduction histidine kinase
MLVRSLSGRLLALWLMLLASAVTTGVLMTAFFRQSASAQVNRTEDFARRACTDIADRYAYFSAGARNLDRNDSDPQLPGQLKAVVERALARATGVEGGLWSQSSGSLAYAFPTYEGSGPKTDLPEAELPSIREIIARTEQTGRPEGLQRPNASQVLVLQACPLASAGQALTAWTMSRVFTGSGDERLVIGLGVLAATVLGSAVWLAYIMFNWSQRVRGIEQELGSPGAEERSVLSMTGERELDRLIQAVNAANLKSMEAQRAAAADQRLAAVGLLAAGLAHEIRNPIAAMRLKAENALATTNPDRSRAALEANLAQIGRLDRILRDLLTMTEAPKPKMEPVELTAFFAGIATDLQDAAQAGGIKLECIVDPMADDDAPPCFDEEQVRRAVCNLIVNAIQHTSPGGRVDCTSRRVDESLHLLVEDSGSGIPEPLAQRVFEPFVTGRPEGTGLGLAIVRETARAHFGEARLLPSRTGASFEIEIPWNGQRF